MLGASPALLVFYVQARVEESPVWLAADRKRRADPSRASYPESSPHLRPSCRRFLFLIILMTAFMSFSDGTQDVYPASLEVQIGLTPRVLRIGVSYGFAQIAGGTSSERSQKSGAANARLSPRRCSVGGDSRVGIRALGDDAGDRRNCHAVHGAGGSGAAYCGAHTCAGARTAPRTAYSLAGCHIVECESTGARSREAGNNNVLAITVVIVALSLALLASRARSRRQRHGGGLTAYSATDPKVVSGCNAP